LLRDRASRTGLPEIESTYGNREHAWHRRDATVAGSWATPSRNAQGDHPAFSVGRTQQIVYVLHELTCAGKLRAPIS